jgi:hypothetical protein
MRTIDDNNVTLGNAKNIIAERSDQSNKIHNKHVSRNSCGSWDNALLKK